MFGKKKKVGIGKPTFKQEKELPKVDGEVREVFKLENLAFWSKRKLAKKPESSFLVTFFFSNGTSRQFVIRSNKETFKYKKRTYYLRYEDAWFDLSFNQYRLYFFDDYASPIDREVVRKGDKSYFSVTPQNLKPLLKMEYVKALAQSQELSKYLKFCLLLAFFNLLVGLVLAFYIYSIYKHLRGG